MSGASSKSGYSFLDDPRRMDPGHVPESQRRSDASHDAPNQGGREHPRADGSRRSQHSWGGHNFDEAVNKMSKSHRGRVSL